MLDKEKEWYDVEIDEDFFDDKVKDLKGFGNFLNKKPSSKSKSELWDQDDDKNNNDENFEKQFDWKISSHHSDDETNNKSKINHKDIKVSNHDNFSAIINTTKKEEVKIVLEPDEIEDYQNQPVSQPKPVHQHFHDANKNNEIEHKKDIDIFIKKETEVVIEKEEKISLQKNHDNNISQYLNHAPEIEIELNDENDEKEPRLSFEEYLVENQINLENIKANICAALYIAGDEGIDVNTLKKVTEQPSWFIKKVMTIMIGEYWKNESIGIAIELYQKVFKFVTKPKCFESLGKVINTKFKNPLSQSVMETLAIIAYNQPCRRSVIEKIRAKDPKSAIDRLISLDLISSKQSDLPGRPFVYTVTNKFYDLFDLKSLSQLPKIETRLLNEIPTNEIDNNIDD